MVISIDERNPVRLLDKQNIPCEIRFYMEFMIPGMHIRVGMEAIKTGEEDETAWILLLICFAMQYVFLILRQTDQNSRRLIVTQNAVLRRETLGSSSPKITKRSDISW